LTVFSTGLLNGLCVLSISLFIYFSSANGLVVIVLGFLSIVDFKVSTFFSAAKAALTSFYFSSLAKCSFFISDIFKLLIKILKIIKF